MFKPVSPKLNLSLMEEEILRFWKRERIFEKTSSQRQECPEFVFYEGPPTANGKPGVHHVLARAFKDIFPRYKIMRGYHVERRSGWDTHGLPVEIGVEQKLGFTYKAQIEEYGIADFNKLCRRSAFDYIQDWERLTDRIGFWVSLEDAYVTFTNEYIESVWWILKSFWEKGLLYQGHKVVPYCPRCGTPLSDHEVALGYEQVDDPSLLVRLPLVDERHTSLLVWTTTPWTLPGNVAVAAHPQVEYATVERDLPEGGTERLILARALVDNVFGEEPVRVVDVFKGRRLKGRRYRPLFTYLLPEKPAYSVILGDFVTTGDGTGLVHIAPAFGAEDLQAAQEHDLPVLVTVADDGTFIPEVRPWSGRFVKDADLLIIQDLQARGLLLQSGTTTHTYPFCWRCDTPLIYYARGTWYIRTSQLKDQLLALNQRIHWVPDHIKDGRFGDWLENNVDWALGRERYWGTPLPIWECEFCRKQVCVGSIAELADLSGQDLSGLDLHRPFVDEVRFPCPDCSPTSGAQMQRVPELIDVWFDSGAMPVAQWHYPFEKVDRFDQQFPADFICEAVDQTRGWFYSLHAISTLLFEREAFRNVICLGLILDENGQKMSNRKGNVVDPWEVINQHGADAFRWYLYTTSPPGQERRFSADLVGEVVRGFTLTLWNVYSFFITYANLDGWKPTPAPPSDNLLDRWLLSELNALVAEVTAALEAYDVTGASRPVMGFVDNLSKWYLRRSRRRFWKNEADQDKQSAYDTLYRSLVILSQLLAPFIPFLADNLYQNLVCSFDEQAPESVHLSRWPEADQSLVDPAFNNDMRLVMKLASLGHAARNQAGVKVRQPLSEIAFSVSNKEEAQVLAKFADLIADELNVKQVRALGSAGEAVSYSLKPLPQQLGRKYRSLFPKVRAAILDLDTDGAARALLDGHSLLVAVEGRPYTILPEDVEVRAEARSGYTVATEGPNLAALVIDLTPELVLEGLAREFVRRVQESRKQAGLDIADRIHMKVNPSPELALAIAAHRQYIMGEILALSLDEGTFQEGMQMHIARMEFDGEQAVIGLQKAA